MIRPQKLADLFRLNVDIVNLQTKGLTHADSLLQPPFRGNCLNWVLGHIVASRNRVLTLLGEHPLWSGEELALYERESAPITPDNSDRALPLDRLLADLARAQEVIADRLVHPGVQGRLAAGDETSSAEQLIFLYFHESYHVGQTELLRQLAGTNDHVI
jgi:hypothetical protein